MDQVRCKRYFYSHLYFILCIETFSLKSVSFFLSPVLFFSFYVHLLLTICVNPAVCGGHVFVQLDHRKATSLPHHHPFGLFLGGSQAPVWNVLSPVSTRNSFFFTRVYFMMCQHNHNMPKQHIIRLTNIKMMFWDNKTWEAELMSWNCVYGNIIFRLFSRW